MIDDPTVTAPPVSRGAPATSQGLPFSTALILTILCALVAVGGSYGVLKSTLSTSAKAALSIITLVSVIGVGYAGFQLLLALVATTGERRWFARQVTERRTGDRARKPKDS
jgi:hypothetical protein